MVGLCDPADLGGLAFWSTCEKKPLTPNVGAFIIRIGFWGIFSHNSYKEPPKTLFYYNYSVMDPPKTPV